MRTKHRMHCAHVITSYSIHYTKLYDKKWLEGEKLEDAYGAPSVAVTMENLGKYFDADGNLITGSQAYRDEHYK